MMPLQKPQSISDIMKCACVKVINNVVLKECIDNFLPEVLARNKLFIQIRHFIKKKKTSVQKNCIKVCFFLMKYGSVD